MLGDELSINYSTFWVCAVNTSKSQILGNRLPLQMFLGYVSQCSHKQWMVIQRSPPDHLFVLMFMHFFHHLDIQLM